MTWNSLNGQRYMHAPNRPDCRSIFEKYEAVAEVFTLEQWEAVVLRWSELLSQQEIADRLHVSRGAVSNRLTRAARRLQEHQQRMRSEAFREQRRALLDHEETLDS